ncbi:MAG TPA: rRNA maturation RNase YbeY [Nitrospirota bacterium]|jgi:probable rRNA maturation factor
MSYLGLQKAELGILITGDRKMRSLNREYRGKDKTTDVLSFPMMEWRDGRLLENLPEGMPLSLGDIVVSAPQAMRQAGEIGQSFEDELRFLIVHGILHLTGWDHERGELDRKRMEKRQRELVAVLKGHNEAH